MVGSKLYMSGVASERLDHRVCIQFEVVDLPRMLMLAADLHEIESITCKYCCAGLFYRGQKPRIFSPGHWQEGILHKNVPSADKRCTGDEISKHVFLTGIAQRHHIVVSGVHVGSELADEICVREFHSVQTVMQVVAAVEIIVVKIRDNFAGGSSH